MHGDCDPEACVHRWVLIEEPGGGAYLVPPSYVCDRQVQVPVLCPDGFGAVTMTCERLAGHDGVHQSHTPANAPFLWESTRG